MPITGDIKYSAIADDHESRIEDGLWIKLKGQNIADLPLEVQDSAVAMFGPATKIPDLTNAYACMTDKALGTITPATSFNITREMLPNVSISGTTQMNTENHDHYMFTNNQATLEPDDPDIGVDLLEHPDAHVSYMYRLNGDGDLDAAPNHWNSVTSDANRSATEKRLIWLSNYQMKPYIQGYNTEAKQEDGDPLPDLGKTSAAGAHSHTAILHLNQQAQQAITSAEPKTFNLNAFVFLAYSSA